MTDVVIIGAGLTGLSTAYQLIQNGQTRVHILERQPRIGGVIHSHSEDGFIYESGPTTGVIGSIELAELLEAFPDVVQMAEPSAKRRLILKDGCFYPLPSGGKSGVKTPLITWWDKFRLLGEPFRKRGINPDETIAELVVRRLGRSYLDYAVDPFIGGIYAGDPRKLVTRYAIPKLYALEQNYGSFIRGAIAKRKEPKQPKAELITREVFSTRGGLSELISHLATAIGHERIHLSASDCTLKPRTDGGWQVYYHQGEELHELVANHVITTCPAQELTQLLPFLSEQDLAPIASLRYAPVVQIAWGMKHVTLPHFYAFGGLVPSREDKELLGILNPGACFPDRVPLGGSLLSIFLGGMRAPQLIDASDEELIELATDRVHSYLGITQRPDLLRLFRHRYAIPQYEASSEARLERIGHLEANYPGLHLAGAVRDGIGISDRVRQAKILADELYTTR